MIIELKAGTAHSAIIGQLLSYIAVLRKDPRASAGIGGMLIAADFDHRVRYAEHPDVKLLKYRARFDFEEPVAIEWRGPMVCGLGDRASATHDRGGLLGRAALVPK